MHDLFTGIRTGSARLVLFSDTSPPYSLVSLDSRTTCLSYISKIPPSHSLSAFDTPRTPLVFNIRLFMAGF